MKNIQCVLIDFQKDFCSPDGSLFVPGAVNAVKNAAALIDRIGDKLTDISCTLDSHNTLHIATPQFWRTRDGSLPAPFTVVSVEDVEQGIYRAARPSLQGLATKYVKSLKKSGKYVLCLWPQHCRIGHVGASLEPLIFDALQRWSDKYVGYVNFVAKGSNVFTEHYGAVEADVPDVTDPSTQINVNFVQQLADSEITIIGGIASSHCVASTVYGVVNNFADIKLAQKLKILKDCVAPVPGFENLEQDLWDFCKKHSIEVIKSTDFLA